MGINSVTGKAINYSAKKLFAKQLEMAVQNPIKFATNMMVLSLVSKDAVNCAFYTYQSYNNKRIPEEKRKFVAALDLVQGFLNVGTQLLAARLIEKHLTPALFNKYIGKKLITGLSGKYSKILVKKHPDLDAKEIQKEVKSYLGEKSAFYKIAQGGFSLIATLLATTALCKRTLVPFIATPIAGKIKEKYMSDDKGGKAGDTPTFDINDALSRYNNPNTETNLIKGFNA